MELFCRSEGGIYVCRQCKKVLYQIRKNGGDGHVSFRRELFVAAGGPDAAMAVAAAMSFFEVDDGLNTLTDFRHVRKYVAGDGEQGGKRRCHGADGEDLIVKVPEGTVIKDFESGKVIADMSGENRREVILKWRQGRSWKYALCDLDDAGSEVCTAGTAGTGTLGTAGIKGNCRCWSGWFYPERR